MVKRGIHDRQRPWRVRFGELGAGRLSSSLRMRGWEIGTRRLRPQGTSTANTTHFFLLNNFLTLFAFVQKADDMETGNKNRSQESERTRLDHRLSREIHVAMWRNKCRHQVVWKISCKISIDFFYFHPTCKDLVPYSGIYLTIVYLMFIANKINQLYVDTIGIFIFPFENTISEQFLSS